MGRKNLKLILLIAAMAVLGLTAFLACGKDEKIVNVPVYQLYYDILGNAEFESDGNYPPPANLDNDKDGNITVILYFNEDIYFGDDTEPFFYKDDIYGFYITADNGPGTDPNFWFPFVPDFAFYLTAEFTIADSCFFETSDPFVHTDSANTRVDLYPVYAGQSLNCYNVTLGSADDQEMVEVTANGKTFWVTQAVYEKFYQDKLNQL